MEKDGITLIDWFDSNQMQVNPDKLQAVAVGFKSFKQVKHFTLAGVDIPCEENENLLSYLIVKLFPSHKYPVSGVVLDCIDS